MTGIEPGLSLHDFSALISPIVSFEPLVSMQIAYVFGCTPPAAGARCGGGAAAAASCQAHTAVTVLYLSADADPDVRRPTYDYKRSKPESRRADHL